MSIVKVYKTDVDERSRAKLISNAIRQKLPYSDISFDLEDCDNVLRVENPASDVDEPEIKKILQNFGYTMEILP